MNFRFDDNVEMAEYGGYHFTFASNVGCKKGECRVFETLPAYRKKGNLLTAARKRILKYLANRVDKPLIVKAVNVAQQTENECGSHSIALGNQFLFNNDVFFSFFDTRKTLYDSLKKNALGDFSKYPRVVKDNYLFEETI